MHTTKTITVALVGNPNAGKTTLFNALSGLRQRVGNYPGVTVEMKKGSLSHDGHPFELIDLPGTYSLAARSPDELVAVELLLGQRPEESSPDVVLAIVDASNLDRHLYLVTQVMELGRPVVVALNMIDVAQAQGVRIRVEELAQRLGVPVVPIQANKAIGLAALKSALVTAASQTTPLSGPEFPEAFRREVKALIEVWPNDLPPFLAGRLLCDENGAVEKWLTQRLGATLTQHVRDARQRLREVGCPVPSVEAKARYGWIRSITAEVMTRPRERPLTWTDRIDRVLTHRLGGTVFFLVVMLVVFQSIFTGAKPLMQGLSAGKDWLGSHLVGPDGLLPPGPLTALLKDGILEGVGSVLVFLPQILILFGFIAILEDCGYMARAAFLMDRLMSRCGLSGKSFIPLLSSMACAVPGIMATRVIENPRDRLATILVAPLMSCSARLPVYVLLIAAFFPDPWWLPGLVMFGMYTLGLVLAPGMAWLLKRTLLRGETPLFVMEMPLYRRPSVRAVLRRMLDAGWMFVRRAGSVILASMVLVWALLYFPHRDASGQSYDALIQTAEQAADEAKQKKEQASENDQDTWQKQQDEAEERANALNAKWKEQSWLGQAGRALEPAFRPLGWDWKIGMAVLASFPAREVVIGTLGLIYNQGRADADEVREKGFEGGTPLGEALKSEWADGRQIPRALSLMVFFALCCQCASTLAVIRRETHSWRWPIFTFTYMTLLAYVAALIVFQVGAPLV